MLGKTDRILYLIRQYLRKELTKAEDKELKEWLSENEEHQKLFSEFCKEDNMDATIRNYLQSGIPDAWTKVQQRMSTAIPVERKTNKYWSPAKMLTAAAIVVAIFLGARKIYLAITTQQQDDQPSTAALVLADGTTVPFQNLEDGKIKTQGVYQVVKNMDDLYYKQNGPATITQALYNTIKTFKGGHCRVIFTDGSTIRMNAASSLQFSVSSPRLTRTVNMTGEALFDVEHDADSPFEVVFTSPNKNAIAGKVKVLGTRFNINAYDDETDRKITLLRGTVKVAPLPMKASETMYDMAEDTSIYTTLNQPGDQAQMQIDGKITVRNVDTAEAVGWENGFIPFNKAPTKNVLNTLERQYNVTVDYSQNNKVPDFLFTGKIKAETKIETVLKIMQFQCEALHLKYDSTTKKITILP